MFHLNNILLSIIIVTYNSERFIGNCLASIYTSTPRDIKFEIIIVDNNSDKKINSSIAGRSNNIIFIKNNKNEGFAKACNQGIKIARGKYIFFLNPDTILQKNAIKNLLTFLENNPKVGVVGPLLVKPDGSLQKWQMGYEKTLWRIFLEQIIEKITLYFRPKWFLRIASSIDLNYTNHYVNREVDWVNGAAIMVRKKILDEISGFDERFFLFYEEIDLQKRIKQSGWKIYHFPKSVVIHYGKKSFRDTDYRIYLKKSRFLYFKKYYSTLFKVFS